VYYEPKRTKGPNDPDRLDGQIPQVAEPYAFLKAAYPINERDQLAMRRDDDRQPPAAHER